MFSRLPCSEVAQVGVDSMLAVHPGHSTMQPVISTVSLQNSFAAAARLSQGGPRLLAPRFSLCMGAGRSEAGTGSRLPGRPSGYQGGHAVLPGPTPRPAGAPGPWAWGNAGGFQLDASLLTFIEHLPAGPRVHGVCFLSAGCFVGSDVPGGPWDPS